MSNKPLFILHTVHVLFWVIFLGLCIKTGALLTSFGVSLFVNEAATKDLYLGLNYHDVYVYDKSIYINLMLVIIGLNAMKATIAYLVIKILMQFKLNSPFQSGITRLLYTISGVALGMGILGISGYAISDWLIKKGIDMPKDWGVGEYLFFAGVIYIVAHVFEKGTALQTENDLTV
jgi:hypothetical protein